jgi:hypothetical protein
MKKILSLILTFMVVMSSFGQFQGTMRATGNLLTFSLRPDANATSVGFSTIEFFLRYPIAQPQIAYGDIVENSTNFPGIGNFKVVSEPASGGFRIDHFIYTAPEPITTFTNYTANTTYDIITVPLGGSEVIPSLEFVHRENEDPFYFVVTDQIGVDRRPASLENYFFPTTTVTGPVGTRVYSMSLTNVALPVKFLSFYALKTGDDAKLNWTVENDEDNASFDIERSTDGRTYSKFATVMALENGKSVNTYNGLDSRLSGLNSNTIYYRIKQLDKSGTALYSPIRTLNVNATGSASLFPNPARTISKLVIDAPGSAKASIVLRDATGKQAMLVNTSLVKGINQVDLNVATLAAGEYVVSVMADGVQHTLKMTKTN